MLRWFEIFYTYIAGVYTQFNRVEILPGVGYCDLALGFIVIALVVSVFWKGARA